jgi:outer membrane protein TolC
MKKSIDKIQSNKKGSVQAEKAVTISRKMYEEGVATFLDLSNSELNLLQAGLSYNQSVFDFISAKADLEKLLGKSINN